MEILALLIPGLLTGLAALIAALAALFKKDERSQKNTEVQSEAVDVIEKIVDGQTHINQMLLDRIKKQDEEIALLKKKKVDRDDTNS
jgi:crotonobetainyl-CoA:carnitine CoA-transferase CaiB-like acyl-CoA transferase